MRCRCAELRTLAVPARHLCQAKIPQVCMPVLIEQDVGRFDIAVHNIQGNTPLGNIEAMFNALRDGGRS